MVQIKRYIFKGILDLINMRQSPVNQKNRIKKDKKGRSRFLVGRYCSGYAKLYFRQSSTISVINAKSS